MVGPVRKCVSDKVIGCVVRGDLLVIVFVLWIGSIEKEELNDLAVVDMNSHGQWVPVTKFVIIAEEGTLLHHGFDDIVGHALFNSIGEAVGFAINFDDNIGVEVWVGEHPADHDRVLGSERISERGFIDVGIGGSVYGGTIEEHGFGDGKVPVFDSDCKEFVLVLCEIGVSIEEGIVGKVDLKCNIAHGVADSDVGFAGAPFRIVWSIIDVDVTGNEGGKESLVLDTKLHFVFSRRLKNAFFEGV